MDTLEKLAQKNKAHQKHLSNDRFSTVVMILVLVPFLFGIAIDVGAINSTEDFNLWLYGLGALCFGLPLAAMGDLMLFSRWLKMTVLPALILVKVQSSKIIQKAEAEENGN
jgi:hypothetical protein